LISSMSTVERRRGGARKLPLPVACMSENNTFSILAFNSIRGRTGIDLKIKQEES